MKKFCLMVVILIAICSFTTSAFAGQKPPERFTAQANFWTYLDDGCTSRSVGVYLDKNSSDPNASVWVYFSEYNYCTNSFVDSASGGAAISEGFTLVYPDSASLGVVVDLYDQTGTVRGVVVDLRWEGRGLRLERRTRETVFDGKRAVSKSSYANGWRDATMHGNVLLDGTDITSGTSAYGSLSYSSGGYPPGKG